MKARRAKWNFIAARLAFTSHEFGSTRYRNETKSRVRRSGTNSEKREERNKHTVRSLTEISVRLNSKGAHETGKSWENAAISRGNISTYPALFSGERRVINPPLYASA
jgi:hypothetical protein